MLRLKEEVNKITEELLEDDELEITDINNLIYAAAPIMTQAMNQPSKRSISRRNKNFWKIRMQKQISNWRKEVPITAETGTGSDNEKLRNKRKIFQKYSVTNDRKVAQLTQTQKQKVQATAQRIRRYEKRDIQNKMFKEDTKQL